MRRVTLPALLLTALLLAGCTAAAPATSATEATTAAPTQATTATTEATTVETTAPQPTLPPNTSGKVEIRTISNSATYPYNSYLITSSNNETVVLDPTEMPTADKLLITPVLITSTHNHGDHNDALFTDACTCEKILYTAADLTVGDFHVYTIGSSHSKNFVKDPPDNMIIVYEVNGLRIAHMGDIGQEALLEDQLAALGEIDIAIMQFENGYSNMDLVNDKGFELMEQLNPKIIIPTHYSQVGVAEMVERYGEVTYFDDILAISKDDLPEDTMNVYIIENNFLFK